MTLSLTEPKEKSNQIKIKCFLLFSTHGVALLSDVIIVNVSSSLKDGAEHLIAVQESLSVVSGLNVLLASGKVRVGLTQTIIRTTKKKFPFFFPISPAACRSG